jgi:hypothetical protein
MHSFSPPYLGRYRRAHFHSSWVDRIPLVLLFGISTSVELFEGRLPRSIVALLHGKQFEIHEAEGAIDRIYETLQTGSDTKLWLGPHLSTSLIEKARDHFQSPEGFIREVKVCIVIHAILNSANGQSMHTCRISLPILSAFYFRLPVQNKKNCARLLGT